MTINLQVPKRAILKPTIAVFGVGGAGGNAVNNMINANLEGVNFIIANTDSQAIEYSKASRKIQLGEALTQGLGAGSYPEVGRASAEESMEEISDYLEGCNMVFITAGMGGGTGTGAAPVIARMAKERGILTVSVVTKPFHFEGTHRMRVAELGLQELQKFVDTLIVIPNQNLFRVADKNTTFADAFKMADDVLHAGVRSVTDLMVMPGLINLDFADVRSVMSEMGKAMMGTGEATGERRAIDAAEAAISNPLLDNTSMHGARGVLINITGGPDMTLFEVDEAANRIREEVDQEANIIFGSAFNQELQGKIRVSVVATGIEGGPEKKIGAATHAAPKHEPRQVDKIVISARGEEAKPAVPQISAEFIVPEAIEPILPLKEKIEAKQPEHAGFVETATAAGGMFYPEENISFHDEPEFVNLEASPEPRMQVSITPEPAARAPQKQGFFSRSLFSFGSSEPVKHAQPSFSAPIQSQEQHREPEHDPMQKQIQIKEGKSFTAPDSLDIPAFLRRNK